MDSLEPVRVFIANALKIDPSSVTEDLQLGGIQQWDSFGHINLMMAMEAEYGVPVTEENVLRHISFSAIAETITRHQPV